MLAALPPADLALLAPHLKEVALGPRELLQEIQDEIAQVYFPHTGMVSLLAVTDEGGAIETAAVGHEGAVGAIAGLGIKRASCRAVVQMPGSASRIAAASFQKVAAESPRIRDLIVRHNETLLAQTQQTAACNALHDVEARLARWLLQAQDHTGSDTIALIQEFLAQVLGVRRTTINLVLGTLHRAGLIRHRRGQIQIVDRNGMKTRSCGCYLATRRQID